MRCAKRLRENPTVKIKTGSASSAVPFCSRAALIVMALGVSAYSQDGVAAVNPNPKSTVVSADVADLIGKAQRALGQGRPEVALIYLKNAEAVAPDVPHIHLQLG